MGKAYTFFGILLAVMGLFSVLVYDSIRNADAEQPIPLDALQGKQIFQRRACIECHTVFGNGGYVGGDLTKSYVRTGAPALTEYLVQAPVLTGAKKKRHEQLTEQDAAAVVAYLRYLSTLNTLDWPLNTNKGAR